MRLPVFSITGLGPRVWSLQFRGWCRERFPLCKPFVTPLIPFFSIIPIEPQHHLNVTWPSAPFGSVRGM